MRAALTLLAALWLVTWLATPAPQCSALTEAQCDRARLIDAGAID